MWVFGRRNVHWYDPKLRTPVWAEPPGSLTAELIRWRQWRQRGACRGTVAVLFCKDCDKKMSGDEKRPQGYSPDMLLKRRLGTGGCGDASFRPRQTNPSRESRNKLGRGTSTQKREVDSYSFHKRSKTLKWRNPENMEWRVIRRC